MGMGTNWIVGLQSCEKKLVIYSPWIILPDFTEGSILIELHTNASTCALGGALLTCSDEKLYLVAYYSQKINPAKCNYRPSNR